MNLRRLSQSFINRPTHKNCAGKSGLICIPVNHKKKEKKALSTTHACLNNLLKFALGYSTAAVSHQPVYHCLHSSFHCQEAAHLHSTVNDSPRFTHRLPHPPAPLPRHTVTKHHPAGVLPCVTQLVSGAERETLRERWG